MSVLWLNFDKKESIRLSYEENNHAFILKTAIAKGDKVISAE